MGSLQDSLCIICHQLRSPDNLGAVARLMANFGFSTLSLSSPVTYAFSDAKKMAVGAERLLDQMQIVHSLQDGISACVYAVGTSSRAQLRRRSPIAPAVAVERLARESARGRVALVFGGEKRGLDDEELALCQDVVVIPTSSAQPSMNLSQAVAVMLFLCSQCGAASVSEAAPRVATLGATQEVEALLESVLLEAGFLNPQAPQHVLGELMRSLRRAALTEREAQLWRSALEHLRREQHVRG